MVRISASTIGLRNLKVYFLFLFPFSAVRRCLWLDRVPVATLVTKYQRSLQTNSNMYLPHDVTVLVGICQISHSKLILFLYKPFLPKCIVCGCKRLDQDDNFTLDDCSGICGSGEAYFMIDESLPNYVVFQRMEKTAACFSAPVDTATPLYLKL